MKKWQSLCLCFAVMVCTVIFAAPKAEAATFGDLTYNISGGEVIITDCNTYATGDLVIPSTIDGYPVTSIGYEAFYNCTSLTSITIPDSVTSIGDYAFYWCTGLQSITIPDGMTRIGDYTFYNCKSLTSITIPGSVTSIGRDAFCDCTSLTSITIPDRVTSIGAYAFSGCTSLQSVTIPDSVTSIGEYAFFRCTSLTSITIPDGVTSIGGFAFYGCTSLQSVTIGSGVTSIGKQAFYNCTSLIDVYISNASAWCQISFADSYSNPMYYAAQLHIIGSDGKEITNVVLDETVTQIPFYAFRNCTSLESITIPDSVTGIGSSAFSGCASLQSITILGSVTSIGGFVFYNCTSLTSITIGNGVTSIGGSAFSRCTSLQSITIPDSVITIGSQAFYNCTNLTDVYISDPSAWCRISFGDHNSNPMYNADQLHIIGEDGKEITNVVLDETVTQIPKYAFKNCTSLQSITIPEGVTSIGNYAFEDCTSLKDVYYTGTQSQWNGISIGIYNTSLTNATIHYNWHEHVFTNYVSNNDATCNDGTKTAKCDICDATDTLMDIGSALGHSFTDYVSNKDATCTADGTKTAKCDRCEETDTVTDPGSATGIHSFTNYVSNNDATCTADGTKTAKCDWCEETDTITDVGTALGHQWDEGIYYPPTLKNEGYTLYTCERCGKTKKEIDALPPQILSQPESVTAESGTAAQFRAEAQGAIVSYKWQYRKLYKWFDTSMTGYNTDMLTVTATGARHGYDYRCVITFADGTVLYTEPAKLTVNTTITVTNQPDDQTVVLGSKGQFTVEAQGEGLKYQWQYCRPGTEKWIDTAMEGATKQTVYIESTTARDGYMYRCQITDVAGKVEYSEVATMRVLSFKSHPAETFAVTGSKVQLTVTTSVDSGFTYRWQYRRSGGAWTNTTMTGYNTATLTVDATKARNGYEYRCVLTGSKNSKIESKGAVLHVGDPLVLEDQSISCTVTAGRTIIFSVIASNAYSYQWEYARAGSDTWYVTTMEGATTENLKVQATAARNGYRYRCIIKGLDGTEIISQPVTLTVK